MVIRLALLVTIGLVMTESVAFACRCGDPGLHERIDSADALFIGWAFAPRLGPSERLSPNAPLAQPRIYRFRVERNFFGAPDESIEVNAGLVDASCSLRFGTDESYIVFARMRDDGDRLLATSACSGTRATEPAFVAELEAVLDEMDDSGRPPTRPTRTPEPTAPTAADAARGNPACGGCGVAASDGLTSLVMLGAFALLAFTRKRRWPTR